MLASWSIRSGRRKIHPYVLGLAPLNAEPYQAQLPARDIIAQLNTRQAYRARDSARLLNVLREESAPDEELNDILWHSIKGRVKPPQRRYSLSLAGHDEEDD